MIDRSDASGRLARLTAVTHAPSAADGLERVLDAAVDVAPRAAMFLVRSGRLRGWRAIGYEDDCRRRLERLDFDPTETWLAPLFDPSAPLLVERLGGPPAPEFGQIPADEAMATALRVGATTIALVVGERSRGQDPWLAAALGTLGILGSLRLELDLARRRSSPPSPPPSPTHGALDEARATPNPETSAPPIGDDTGAPLPFAAVVRMPPSELVSDLVPYDEGDALRRKPGREHEARRFARLVASDIRLYNEEAVLIGRSRGDLALRLDSALARGRESFLRRFPDLGPVGLVILDDAYVEVLAAGDAGLLRAGAQPREP